MQRSPLRANSEAPLVPSTPITSSRCGIVHQNYYWARCSMGLRLTSGRLGKIFCSVTFLFLFFSFSFFFLLLLLLLFFFSSSSSSSFSFLFPLAFHPSHHQLCHGRALLGPVAFLWQSQAGAGAVRFDLEVRGHTDVRVVAESRPATKLQCHEAQAEAPLNAAGEIRIVCLP